MPTWAEVQEYARSKYNLAEDHEYHFSLVFVYGDSGRAQKVLIRRFTAFNQEWIDFSSACCQKDEMHPIVALKKNADFAVGNLCLDGPEGQELYIFRYSVPLATMDMEEFELPLHVVASTADQLEGQFAAGDRF